MENGCNFISVVPIGKGYGEYIVSSSSFNEALKRIQGKALEDPKKTIRNYAFLKKLYIISGRLLGFSGSFLPFSTLRYFYNFYHLSFSKFQLYVLLPHASERFLEKEVKEKFPDDFPIITSTPKPFEHNKLNLDIFKFSSKKISRKYGWMNIYSCSEDPFNAEYFDKYKLSVDREAAKKSFLEIKKNNLKFKQFVRKLAQKDKQACLLMRELVYIRTDRAEVMKIAGLWTYPFMRRLAKKIGGDIGLKEVSMLSHTEVLDVLSGKKNINPLDLVRRAKKEDVTIVFDKHGTSFKNGMDYISELRAELKKSDSFDELRGFVAQKGNAQGYVRIYIQGQTEFRPEENGYVFVARHTMPKDLPFMQKAKAIVTDEGGVTSHSAIVARELRIPCIIGTKVATKILKDGDLVEVDANEGIVRRMKN